MRLTLRTLLAHKDGVLERSDAEILEGKIRESPSRCRCGNVWRHVSEGVTWVPPRSMAADWEWTPIPSPNT